MNNIENITCECGTIFPWTNDLGNDQRFASLLRPSHCPECTARIGTDEEQRNEERRRFKAEGELKQAREDAERNVMHITPIRYRQTDSHHQAFNRDLWKKANTWRPSDETPFLGITGESGACKTRVSYMLLRDIVVERARREGGRRWHRQQQPRFAALTSPDFSLLVGRQFLVHSGFGQLSGEDPKAAARHELDRIRRCDFLFLDDLGKAKNTPSVSAELFAIIDHRHAENLATIWTANSTPEQIVEGMSEDMAGPLAGRLIECSTIIRA